MREAKAREYLRTIYALELSGPVRGVDIARELNKTKATVSVALRSLIEEGYLRRDSEHLIHTTESGQHLARESIHQTVSSGRAYHALTLQLSERMDDEKLLWQHKLRWLEKERAASILEAQRILSRRYYCVRIVDIAHFLELSSSTVRNKVKRLEHGGFLRLGEDSVVTLTETGERAAEQFYAAHETLRREKLENGLSADEAERQAARDA